MDKENNEILLKARSARACMADGYRLFTGNFRRLFRRSWAAAVAYALVYGVTGVVSLRIAPQLTALAMAVQANPQANAQAALMQYLTLMSQQMLVLLAMVVMTTLLTAYGVSALREHAQSGTISTTRRWLTFDRHSVWRTVKAALFVLLLALALFALMAGESALAARFLSPTASVALLLVLALVVLVFALPVVYIEMRYLMDDGIGFWRDLTSGYATGFRHWGFAFVVQLATVLIAGMATLFVALPANVLTLANLQAEVGVLNGDPLGMPAYMGWLTFVVFVVAGFMQAYIHLSTLFPSYYMYGSIETQEQERKDFNSKK